MATINIRQEPLTEADQACLAQLRLWVDQDSTSFSPSEHGLSFCNDKDLANETRPLKESMQLSIRSERNLLRSTGEKALDIQEVPVIAIALREHGELRIGKHSLHNYRTYITERSTLEGKGEVLLFKDI